MKLLSPIWSAIGSIFTTPLAAVLCVFGGIMLLVLWPIVPFVIYFEKKKEAK